MRIVSNQKTPNNAGMKAENGFLLDASIREQYPQGRI